MGNYYAPFSLRISETLITKLKIIAIENKRSMLLFKKNEKFFQKE